MIWILFKHYAFWQKSILIISCLARHFKKIFCTTVENPTTIPLSPPHLSSNSSTIVNCSFNFMVYVDDWSKISLFSISICHFIMKLQQPSHNSNKDKSIKWKKDEPGNVLQYKNYSTIGGYVYQTYNNWRMNKFWNINHREPLK